MKYYGYFPGCTLKAGSVAYDLSARAISKVLGFELMELEDWNCCGATAYSSIAETTAFCISGRNLALAEKTGLDLVAACSACYLVLRKTSLYLKEYPRLRGQVQEALAAGGLDYKGGVKVRHIADVLLKDIGPEAIRVKRQRSLDGLRVAVYYGCQIVRPILDFDHPELPKSLDEIVMATGAQAVSFPLRGRCCGGSSIVSRENMALELIQKVLYSATESGAQCLVTVCPLCQINLDAYQDKVNKIFHTNYNIPVLFITQLLGIVLGIHPKDLGLGTNILSVEKVLSPYLPARR